MDLEKTLKNYGLSQKQAKIYLACLELGSASVAKISQKAGLARSTSYEVLESLKQQGLVSTFQKKKVQYFSAEEPQRVINLAQEKANLLEQALPQLRAIYGQAKVQPTVRFYQGKQGMKLILDEVLAEAKETLTFSSADDLFATLEYFPEFVKKRLKRKIPARVILRDSKKARERQRLGPQELRQVKIIPPDYEYHGMIFVAKIQRTMFEVIWQGLPGN
jgi:sugar-specific transcriptional regulator TrmB